jgi:acyl-CoA dehydrogenase
MASAILKKFEDEGRQTADRPIAEWALRNQMYRLQEQLHGFLRNFPNRPAAAVLRLLVFPVGRTYSAASDELGHEVAKLLMEPGAVRDRLCSGVYVSDDADDAVGQLATTLEAVIAAEPAYRKMRDAVREGRLPEMDPEKRLKAAKRSGVLSDTEYKVLLRAEELTAAVIAVDDFDFDALGRGKEKPVRKARKKRSTA